MAHFPNVNPAHRVVFVEDNTKWRRPRGVLEIGKEDAKRLARGDCQVEAAGE